MPRKPRVEYAGALYHVMSRGDRGAAIVRNDDDRVLFMETLGDACARTGWRIHAYVLMDNHYHLLLETPEANLVKGMAWFLSTYTLRYNARHKQRGHVFQGRYKAVMIEPEEGGFTERVSTYIHLNPLCARMVRWPEESARPELACGEPVEPSMGGGNDTRPPTCPARCEAGVSVIPTRFEVGTAEARLDNRRSLKCPEACEELNVTNRFRPDQPAQPPWPP